MRRFVNSTLLAAAVVGAFVQSGMAQCTPAMSVPTRISGPSELVLAVCFGDFNHDGRLDIATSGVNVVTVRLQDDSGNFPVTGTYAVGGSLSWSLTTGDFNGDGALDIAVALVSGVGQVWVLLGNGNGTFQAPTIACEASDGPGYIVAADLNHDGRDDIIIAEEFGNGSISVIMSQPGGGFAPRVQYVTGPPRSIAVADMNGDGKLDLVVVGQRASLLNGRGDGTFDTSQVVPTLQILQTIESVAVGDLDGDGIPDLVLGGGTGQVALMHGLGDETFAVPQTFNVSGFPATLVIRDVNGDGVRDIFAATNTGYAAILRGFGNGQFMQPVSVHLGQEMHSTQLGDLSGDGRSDLAWIDVNGSDYFVSTARNTTPSVDFNGDGDQGTDADIEAFFRCIAGTCCPLCSSADFNGDGDVGTDADIESFFRVLAGGPC